MRIFIGMSEVKDMYGMSRDTFYRAAKRGEITIYKPGGRVYTPGEKQTGRSLLKVSEVSEWIEGRKPSEPHNGGRLAGKSGAKR